MKTVFLILLITFSSFGQNTKEERQRKLEEKKEKAKQKSERQKIGIINCEDLKVEKDELKGTTTYAFENNTLKLPYFTVTKTEKNNGMEYSINFYCKTPYCDNNMKGIYLKLENNEFVRFPDIQLKCSNISSYGYILQGSLVIDDKLYSKLILSKIIEYSLGNAKKKVEYKNPGDFKTLIECLYK